MGARLRRPAPELLLVEPNHRVRDLHRDALSPLARAFCHLRCGESVVLLVHRVPLSSPRSVTIARLGTKSSSEGIPTRRGDGLTSGEVTSRALHQWQTPVHSDPLQPV